MEFFLGLFDWASYKGFYKGFLKGFSKEFLKVLFSKGGVRDQSTYCG